VGAGAERSKTLLLVKNLDTKATQAELAALFSKHGRLGTMLLVPGGTIALVEFLEVHVAYTYPKKAYCPARDAHTLAAKACL
jgi:multiple RNA-binding domain-containing protein 1